MRRSFAVEIGTNTMSSWFCPAPDGPFSESTPTTSNGTLEMRISPPTGSSLSNSCLATVAPISATLPAPCSSARERAPGGERPVADDEIIGGGAVHGGVPVLAAAHDLVRPANRRRRGLPLRQLRADRRGVALGQGVTRAALPAHAAVARRARHDHEDVGAERADLLGNLR